MVSCTFISVLIQIYEWWYGKSSTLAIRNACATSHVHVYILACHILTSKKNYFSWDTFRCIYFSAWLLFSSTACSPSFLYIVCKKSRQLLENLAWILSKKCMVSHDVPSQMCWIPRKDLMTYHPRCVEFQEKISWRTIPDVLNSKKRSHDVPSQMCWIPRKDLMTYHPRCVEFQERSHDVPSQMCWIPRKDLMT